MRARAALAWAASIIALASSRLRRGHRDCGRPRRISNAVAECLARERRFAAAGGVIELKLLEFVVARRGDGDIGIGRTVGSVQDLVEDAPCPQEETRIVPSLDRD